MQAQQPQKFTMVLFILAHLVLFIVVLQGYCNVVPFMDSAAIPSTMKRAFWYRSYFHCKLWRLQCSHKCHGCFKQLIGWEWAPHQFNIDGLRIGRPFLKGSITPVIYVYINVCEFYVKNSILSYPKKKQYGFSMSP